MEMQSWNYTYLLMPIGGDINDRKSTSGSIILLDSNPVVWKSNKQSCIATSTMQAELISLFDGFSQLESCYLLLKAIGVDMKMVIFCDNQAVIACINRPIQNLPRHIGIKVFFMKEKLEQYGNSLELRYVQTKENLADIFTKVLSKNTYLNEKSKLKVQL